MRKIALEEHFMAPGMEDYWAPSMVDVPPTVRSEISKKLNDFADLRLAAMDSADIERSILGLAGPGVQRETDIAQATQRAVRANDFLADVVTRRPDRYSGFAHLPTIDADRAADELERCVREFGFKGAMINGQTDGRYLDSREYDVLWERASRLQAPIYLHPADPFRAFEPLSEYPQLTRATWGWSIETASHALRIIFGGVFDRFPEARLILGHMGETLPFLLWRFDSRYKLYEQTRPLKRLPSEYIRTNLVVTTSGQCSNEALLCTLSALGPDNVMFSVDYPFESSEIAANFIEAAPISEEQRAKICYANAEKFFNL